MSLFNKWENDNETNSPNVWRLQAFKYIQTLKQIVYQQNHPVRTDKFFKKIWSNDDATMENFTILSVEI